MKVGIIGLGRYTEDLNVGTVLLTWAFQNYLKNDLDVSCEVIDYIPRGRESFNYQFPFITYFKNKQKYNFILSCLRCVSRNIRYKKLLSFWRNKISLSEKQYTYDDFSNRIQLDYDYIIAASDIIWSPCFNNEFDATFFGKREAFKAAGVNFIVYSTSMGNADLNENQLVDFARLTENLSAVSYRESYLFNLLSRYLSNETLSWVLDPALLLNECDYNQLGLKNLIDKPYCLIYFPFGYSKSLVHDAIRYCNQHKLKLVEISNYPWHKIKYSTFSEYDPIQFLSLFKYAKCVFTNSFHGVCFSVVFKKDFYAFSRPRGNKVADICKRFGLEERYIGSNAFIQSKNKIDFEKVYEKLNLARKDSNSFLYKALHE